MTKLNGASLTPAEPPSWRLVGPALQIVRAGPIAAYACLVSLIAVVVVGSLGPFVVGAAVAAFIIVGRLLFPRVWREAAADEAVKAVELPSEAELTDRGAKALLARLGVARTELDQVLAGRRGPRRGELLMRLRNIRELERSAVVTLARIEFLATAPKSLVRPVGPPERDERETRSPAAASILERAAAARAEREAAIQELETRRLEELARLEYLTACLEAFPAELMELELIAGEALQVDVPDPLRDADVIREEVRQIKEELGELTT